MGFRICGLGLGFRVWGLGFEVLVQKLGLGFRASGVKGFRCWGSGVCGFGFWFEQAAAHPSAPHTLPPNPELARV